MTIKLKLFGGGIIISLLLLGVLLLAVISFGSLSGGFSAVVERSATGVDNSRATESQISAADSSLSGISQGMLALVDEINKANQQVKVLERKINTISGTLKQINGNASQAAEGLPAGTARYAVEDVVDALGDIEETVRREALVSLTRTVGKMDEFTQAINAKVADVKQLAAELAKVRTLSSGVVTANQEIRALSQNFSGEIALSRNLIVGVLLVAVLLSLTGALLLTRSITRPLNRANEIARGIAAGDLDQRVDIMGKDEIGQLGTSMAEMIKNLKQDIEETRRRADEATRIRMALDVCSTNVMVADPEQRIIYQNHSSATTLKNTEPALRQGIRGLSAERMIGANLGEFHPSPAERRRTLAGLSKAQQEDLELGGRHLRLIATPVFNESQQRLGTALEWTDRTDLVLQQREEQARAEQEARVANENLRIRVALDNVSSSVMMADTERRILYLNRAAQRLFQGAESDIRKDLPGFQANNLLGRSIDDFHRNPAHQQTLLKGLDQAHVAEVHIGGRTMRIIANPVRNDAGERLGTAVEWTERTAEVAVEAEVASIVAAAREGDLSRRIMVDGKEGFFRQLGLGINALIDQVVQIFDEMSEVMAAMAQGDLTLPMRGDYRGSFDTLKGHVNDTLDNLRDILIELREGMAEMHGTADEISSGNNNLSARTEQQAANLEETASSMEELTSTVRNNADNAQQANQLATNARGKAEQGGDVVSRAVQAMDAINSSSHKIAEIIGVIDEIAFQTNLLALNASVEAARAGDQGRSFAVVATEVRNLAGRSASAAKAIKELIRDSGNKVALGAELVSESGSTLAEIVQAVKRVGDIVAEIAAASAEQASGIDQVNQSVTAMDEMTQQNAALAEQTSAASASMSDKSAQLNQLVARFTL